MSPSPHCIAALRHKLHTFFFLVGKIRDLCIVIVLTLCLSGMVPTDIVRVNMFLSSVSGIPPHEVTFAEMAKQKGYTTAAVGRRIALLFIL